MTEFLDHLGHPLFYVESKGVGSKKYQVLLKDGWDEFRADEWVMISPNENDIPRHGWKIHVSSVLKESHELLDKVVAVCYRYEVPFKHLDNQRTFFMRNYKDCAREHVGIVYVLKEYEDIVESKHLKKLLLIKKTLTGDITVFPGLFNGLTGINLINSLFDNDRLEESLERLITSLEKYLIEMGDGLVLAGDGGLRLTTDIISGGAGILIAIDFLIKNKKI